MTPAPDATYTRAFAAIADARAALKFAAELLESLQTQGVPPTGFEVVDDYDGCLRPNLWWMPPSGGDLPSLTLYVDGPAKTRWVYYYVVNRDRDGNGLEAREEGRSVADAIRRIGQVAAVTGLED